MIRVGVVVLFAVLQPLSSLLANLLPGEQASTGDVSDRYVHLLTPAGYAFAIWGLIYLASLGLAGYQALPAQHTRTVHRVTGWWIAGAFAASTAWVPIFVSGALGFAQVVIIALVGLLAAALARLTRLGPAPSAAWIGSRVLAAAGFAGLLAWGLVAVAVATSESAVVVTAVLAAVVAIAAVGIRAARAQDPTAVLFG